EPRGRRHARRTRPAVAPVPSLAWPRPPAAPAARSGGVEVRGRVEVAGTGEPCPAGEVHLYARQAYGAIVRGDGSFTSVPVAPGTYAVLVQCQGYLADDAAPHVVVGDREVDGLVFQVRRGATIAGRVHDEHGAALAGVTVSAGPSRARSSADGAFELGGLVAGTYVVWVAGARRTPFDGPTVTLAADGHADVEVEVPAPHGMIVGRVVDEGGRGIGGVQVGVTDRAGAWGYGATTDDDGSFSFARVDEGAVWVRVLRSPPSDVPPGAPTDEPGPEAAAVIVRADDPAEVELVAARDHNRITGVVVDASGEPMSGLAICAELERRAAGEAAARGPLHWYRSDSPSTDDDGRFVLDELADGHYRVEVRDGDSRAASAEHVAIGDDVRLVLHPIDPDSRPPR
ncbi:MAG TPA: carboxypeptidase-like regulatory domain-containing protein, partial [Kofleriaceae bacterium]|nr:carboxypeptidase-like regulatory domain-containing protein [Kofleriaceae bacterium]